MPDKIAVPSGNVGSSSIEAIEGIKVATNSAVHDMSALGMFMQADLVVKSVIIALLLSSVWCWKIIFEKFVRYRDVNIKMADFEKSVWSGRSLEDRYEAIKSKANFPIARVFVAGMYEWMTSEKSAKANQSGGPMLRTTIHERVIHAMESTKNREVGSLEKNLSFLATVGSAAPFIGLFGTVWGIMRSFQAIAMTQNTTLAVVAPGLAEALFATAIGLFAAIPAVIFYNKYANQVASFTDRLDSFIDEFSAVLSRELDKS